mmetsp:Transcript_92711/g.262299  ORF Transcript_92711/g.262299 Transcript_92711/m.262299 type:complete len:249 (+) Transcript_92711:871-1617(+)
MLWERGRLQKYEVLQDVRLPVLREGDRLGAVQGGVLRGRLRLGRRGVVVQRARLQDAVAVAHRSQPRPSRRQGRPLGGGSLFAGRRRGLLRHPVLPRRRVPVLREGLEHRREQQVSLGRVQGVLHARARPQRQQRELGLRHAGLAELRPGREGVAVPVLLPGDARGGLRAAAGPGAVGRSLRSLQLRRLCCLCRRGHRHRGHEGAADPRRRGRDLQGRHRWQHGVVHGDLGHALRGWQGVASRLDHQG